MNYFVHQDPVVGLLQSWRGGAIALSSCTLILIAVNFFWRIYELIKDLHLIDIQFLSLDTQDPNSETLIKKYLIQHYRKNPPKEEPDVPPPQPPLEH